MDRRLNMKTNKNLTPSEAITIIRILEDVADGSEVYWGYDDMEEDRKELLKIIEKLEKYL